MSRPRKVYEATKCKCCGKELHNGKPFCDQKCYMQYIKTNGRIGKSKELNKLSGANRCYRCGKPIPSDRVSAYCTACENSWEV